MLTALIVDDEPLARVHLRRLLEQQDVTIVAEAENAAKALQLAEDLCPALLFFDIQMPGLTGLQAASALLHLDKAPLLIFVTGYSEHAVAAFEKDALDYLVKPVSPERLATTLMRARERLAGKSTMQQRATIEARLSETPMQPLQRLPVRKDYSVLLIRIEEIRYAQARERRVYIRTAEGEHRTYYSLTQLESLLPPSFFRIHDSYLVNMGLVEEVIFLGNHAYMMRLSDGSQLPVGRSRYPELQRRLGLHGDAS